jgi:hypothetical protein
MNEGHKNLRTLVIRDEVKATAFSFYTAEEVKKISVKRILTTASLDVLGNPIPGGLYDPAMGPLNRFETYIAPRPRTSNFHPIFAPPPQISDMRFSCDFASQASACD